MNKQMKESRGANFSHGAAVMKITFGVTLWKHSLFTAGVTPMSTADV